MIENEHVRNVFRASLDHQPDVGGARIISNWFFEPANIFDSKPRKGMKPGVVLGLVYLSLMVVVCAASNLIRNFSGKIHVLVRERIRFSE